MSTPTYALGFTIHLPDGGNLEFNRDGINSESDLIFMAGVIELRCKGPISFRCSRIVDSQDKGFQFTRGTISGGKVIWEARP
jgi:hypothetical protein